MTYYNYYDFGAKKNICIPQEDNSAPLTEHPDTGSKIKRIGQRAAPVRFRGTGWPGIEASGGYTNVQRQTDGTLKVLK